MFSDTKQQFSENFMRPIREFLKGLVTHFSSSPVDEEMKRMMSLQRQDLILKLIGTTVGAVITLGISLYGIKWILKSVDPSKQEKEDSQKRADVLMKSIGLSNIQLTDYELCIATNLVESSSMSTDWEDIGGLQETIEEIKETIINPFKHKQLFASTRLVQAPKGVLLYGPPGCGKTLIAKATAKATGARFLNLQVSSLVNKWYGESEKRAEAVFSLAKKIQPTIIFIDEIDSFLRERTSYDHEATRMMKTQFMTFWDGLSTDDNSQVVVMGATNRASDVDAAILRRMPSKFYIGLPNAEQRKQILKVTLKHESVHKSVDLEKISNSTEGWSGSDLRELCRSAAMFRVRELIKLSEEGCTNMPTTLGELNQVDFDKAFERSSQSKITQNTVYQQYMID